MDLRHPLISERDSGPLLSGIKSITDNPVKIRGIIMDK
jgi:hypothetical protein